MLSQDTIAQCVVLAVRAGYDARMSDSLVETIEIRQFDAFAPDEGQA